MNDAALLLQLLAAKLMLGWAVVAVLSGVSWFAVRRLAPSSGSAAGTAAFGQGVLLAILSSAVQHVYALFATLQPAGATPAMPPALLLPAFALLGYVAIAYAARRPAFARPPLRATTFLLAYATAALLQCHGDSLAMAVVSDYRLALRMHEAMYLDHAAQNPVEAMARIARICAIANESLFHLALFAAALAGFLDAHGAGAFALRGMLSSAARCLRAFVADPTRAVLLTLAILAVATAARVCLSADPLTLGGGAGQQPRGLALGVLWQQVLRMALLPAALVVVAARGTKLGALGSATLLCIACAASVLSLAAMGQTVTPGDESFDELSGLFQLRFPPALGVGAPAMPVATLGWVVLLVAMLAAHGLVDQANVEPTDGMVMSWIGVTVVAASLLVVACVPYLLAPTLKHELAPGASGSLAHVESLSLLQLHAAKAGATVVGVAIGLLWLGARLGRPEALRQWVIPVLGMLGALAVVASIGTELGVQMRSVIEGGRGLVSRGSDAHKTVVAFALSAGMIASWCHSALLASLVPALLLRLLSCWSQAARADQTADHTKALPSGPGRLARAAARPAQAPTRHLLLASIVQNLHAVFTVAAWALIAVAAYLLLAMDGPLTIELGGARLSGYAEYQLFGVPSSTWVLFALLGPGLLSLPLTLPLALSMGQRPNILLLRPFDCPTLVRPSATLVRRVLSRLGAVYTLSDSSFYDRWYVRWPVVAPQLWFLTYRLPRVRSEEAVERTSIDVSRWFLRNLNWINSRSKLFTIAASLEHWKALVSRMIEIADLIVVDVSERGAGLEWEVQFLRSNSALQRTIFVVTSEHAEAAADWLRSLGLPAPWSLEDGRLPAEVQAMLGRRSLDRARIAA